MAEKTDYEVKQVTTDIFLLYVVSVCNRYHSEVLLLEEFRAYVVDVDPLRLV